MASTLSPTSQLWAKQIRREHGFLQKQMHDMDSKANENEDRIKAVENAVRANGGGDSNAVAALAKQVRELDPNSIKERINGMEQNVKERLDDIDADNLTMTKVIEGFERDKQVAEEERKATLTKDKALLKRIGEVEGELKKYQKNLDLIGKKVNGSRLDQIKDQLDGLTKQVMEEGEQMTLLTESVAKLETANTALVKANEKLEAQLKKSEERLSKQEARAGAEAATTTTPHADASDSPDESTSQRKKSHKWAGGGADRDIIRQGADLFGIKSVPKPPAPKPKSAESEKPTVQVPKKKPTPKKKKLVPKPSSDGSKRKSHKWGGGGADRDIIAAGLTQDSKLSYEEPWTQSTVAPKPQTKVKEVVDGKEVVRSGRGWIEVEDSPTPEMEPQAPSVPVKKPTARPKKPVLYDENGNPIKRPRGRPRKYPRPEESQTQSVTESARSSVGPGQGAPDTKKRTADTAFEFTVPGASETLPKRPKNATGEESGAKPTPVPSSPPRRINYAPHVAEDTAKAAPATIEKPAPKLGRRQIVQLTDDFDVFIRRMNE